MLKDNKILVGKNKDLEEYFILPNMACRHGLITGASGSGKTITLKVLAESFSSLGCPVFLADVKGDLAGMCKVGDNTEKIQERLKNIGIENFNFRDFSTTFWDVYGDKGIPVRARIEDIGYMIMSRMLGLNETQEGVLNIVFKVASDKGLKLVDLKDLKSVLQYVGDNRGEFTTSYGNISSQSIGSIQRSLLVLEEQAGNDFFGEPNLSINDLMKFDPNTGNGIINVLDATKLFQKPTLYASFLLWLLNELNTKLPELGDVEKPKLVFFFDEAHLLFSDMPSYMIKYVTQVVKLIRSKGVSLFFISQSPKDIPDEILSQLSNKIQHSLRAYTPSEQKNIKAIADSYRSNSSFDTAEVILSLGTGEAIVSFLNEKGEPNIVDRVTILPPQSFMGTIDDITREVFIRNNELYNKYKVSIDDSSAFEQVQSVKEQEEKEKQLIKEEEEKKKLEEKLAREKEKQKTTTRRGKSTTEKAIDRMVTTGVGTLTRKFINKLFK